MRVMGSKEHFLQASDKNAADWPQEMHVETAPGTFMHTPR